MEVTKQVVESLRAFAAALKPTRNDASVINDMFEAADDWRGFAESLTRTEPGLDPRPRARQEQELFDALASAYSEAIAANPAYAEIMRLGALLIREGKSRVPHPDGYLGSKRIVRHTFQFLQDTYGFVPKQDDLSVAIYISDQTQVMLRTPPQVYAPIALENLSKPGITFVLEDVLFMAGQPVPLFPEDPPPVTTEAEVEALFAGAAAALQRYGGDQLANPPGALDPLAAAAAERERRYVAECERLFGHLQKASPAAKPGST